MTLRELRIALEKADQKYDLYTVRFQSKRSSFDVDVIEVDDEEREITLKEDLGPYWNR
jgi:hypothetical protein